MNRPGSEMLALRDAPTPQQLRRLTLTGASSAMRRNKLRRLERMDDSYLFVDHVDVPVALNEMRGTGNVRHVIGARLGKLATADVATWEAKYYDTYRVERDTGKWLVASTSYDFVWQPERTLVAERNVKVRGETHAYYHEELGVDDMVERFYIHDDDAAFLNAQVEFEAVTASDCEDLISMLSRYYAGLQ